MNAKERKAIADTLIALRIPGLTLQRDDLALMPREARVVGYLSRGAAAPIDSVRLSVNIGRFSPCIHWHAATRRLRPSVFRSVNQYHGTKATTYAADWPALIAELSRIASTADIFEVTP